MEAFTILFHIEADDGSRRDLAPSIDNRLVDLAMFSQLHIRQYHGVGNEGVCLYHHV
jgi:hypothetical protein